MRVRVKDGALTRTSEDDPEHRLTERRDYFMLDLSERSFRLVNDGGEPILYPKALFEVLDPSVPPEWRFDAFEDGEYHLEPKSTAEPGFYESYFGSDDDRSAEVVAHAVVRAVLEAARDSGTDADRIVIEAELKRLIASIEDRGPSPHVFNLEAGTAHTYMVSLNHLWAHNSCEIPKFSARMKSISKPIADGKNIDKVQVLVEKFGGKETLWSKRKTWDSLGREIHYYEHPGIGVRRARWDGDLDPF